MPNLLLDNDVQWVAPVSIIPRLNTVPRGYQTFRFDDRAAVRALNLPNLDPAEDQQHLIMLTTGPYIIHRQENNNLPENIERTNIRMNDILARKSQNANRGGITTEGIEEHNDYDNVDETKDYIKDYIGNDTIDINDNNTTNK